MVLSSDINDPVGHEATNGKDTWIFGGGGSLPGAPKSWEEFKQWVKEKNEEKPEAWEKIEFFADCHCKLDFDGPILSLSCRFYPPAKLYGPKWDGSISVYLLDEKIKTIKIEYDTLDELHDAIIKNTQRIIEDIKTILKQAEYIDGNI